MAPLYPKMSSSPASSLISPTSGGAGFDGVENSPISASSQDSIPTSIHLQDHLDSSATVSSPASVSGVAQSKCVVCGNTAENGEAPGVSQSGGALKVLPCRHVICQSCIEVESGHSGAVDVSCPLCHQFASLLHDSSAGLMTTGGQLSSADFVPSSMYSPISATAALDVSTSSSSSGVCVSSSGSVVGSVGSVIGSIGGMSVTQAGPASPYSPTTSSSSGPHCTGCKSKEHNAVARCFDCSNLLCPNCVMAHQFMHCFEGHRVVALSPNGDPNAIGSLDEVFLASIAATVNSQMGNRLHESSPSTNSHSGNSSHLLSSPTMDPTHLLNGIRSETSLAPGGPVAGHSNGQPSPPSSADSSLLMSPVSQGSNGGGKLFNCPRHKNEGLKYFCFSCDYPICKECVMVDHGKGHEYDLLSEVGGKELERIQGLVDEAKTKAQDLKGFVKSVEHACSRLQLQYHKAQNDVNETHTFYRSMLDERKLEALKELDSILNSRQVSFSTAAVRIQEASDKLFQTTDFVERLMKQASPGEVLLFKKTLTSRLCNLINFSNDVALPANADIEFVSNFQAIQIAVRNTYGYIRQGGPGQESSHGVGLMSGGGGGGGLMSGGGGGFMSGGGGGKGDISGVNHSPAAMLAASHAGHNPAALRPSPLAAAAAAQLALEQHQQQQHQHGRAAADALAVATLSAAGAPSNFAGQMSSLEALAAGQHNGMPNGNFGISPQGVGGPGMVGAGYEKWSSAGADMGIVNPGDLLQQLQAAGTTDPIIDLTSKLISANIYPPKSQIKRQKMIYHCKFGEFGVMEGQFTEPSGVAVNAQNDIVVADTNNHRIQIFDKEGRFKFQFGECGKRDGQLLYPNRVAVVKPSGDIIVTERSPTHQIQIYNQYGQFVRKFGANILQHPRGVTVDNKGRIIIVECKVMRVIIFDQMGNVLSKFGCSKHLEFPNGVVVNDRQEIFISDNRAHCVKVFNYEGQFLRQVGGEGITNYPIGVGINANGEILIADNHNNFNLTIFTQDGQLVNALESKVKHAQCFDVSLMDDGTIVLASKDYRIYLYRYIQLPGLGM